MSTYIQKTKYLFRFHYPHNDKTIEIISSRIFTPEGVNAC
jgi:hypothetical protein